MIQTNLIGQKIRIKNGKDWERNRYFPAEVAGRVGVIRSVRTNGEDEPSYTIAIDGDLREINRYFFTLEE